MFTPLFTFTCGCCDVLHECEISKQSILVTCFLGLASRWRIQSATHFDSIQRYCQCWNRWLTNSGWYTDWLCSLHLVFCRLATLLASFPSQAKGRVNPNYVNALASMIIAYPPSKQTFKYCSYLVADCGRRAFSLVTCHNGLDISPATKKGICRRFT